MVTVSVMEEGFSEWRALLALLDDAFAYMESRIDPPSSLHLLNEETITQKAVEETLLLVRNDGKLVGCCFLKNMGEKTYLGKLAVDPKKQQSGVGLALLNFAIDICRSRGNKLIELQSRIELAEVHDFFRRRGFRQTGVTSHDGYDHPTSITMQLEL